MNCQPVLLVHLQAEDLLNVQQYAEGDLIDGWGGYGHDDGLPLPHECLRNLGAVGGGAQGAVRRVVPSHLVRAIWVWKWKQVLRGDLIPNFKCVQLVAIRIKKRLEFNNGWKVRLRFSFWCLRNSPISVLTSSGSCHDSTPALCLTTTITGLSDDANSDSTWSLSAFSNPTWYALTFGTGCILRNQNFISNIMSLWQLLDAIDTKVLHF